MDPRICRIMAESCPAHFTEKTSSIMSMEKLPLYKLLLLYCSLTARWSYKHGYDCATTLYQDLQIVLACKLWSPKCKNRALTCTRCVCKAGAEGSNLVRDSHASSGNREVLRSTVVRVTISSEYSHRTPFHDSNKSTRFIITVVRYCSTVRCHVYEQSRRQSHLV